MGDPCVNQPYQGPPNRSFSGPTKRLFSEPALTVITINIEGFSDDKSILLSRLCQRHSCDILCVQETHRGSEQQRPQIAGMVLIAEIEHKKYGSAVFAKPSITVLSVDCISEGSIEFITVDLGNCTVTSVYKPPNDDFRFIKTKNFDNHPTKLVLGDFNSHSTTWGYAASDSSGEAVERWSDSHDLELIHSAKLPASFYSRRWRRGYNPDLAFCSANIRPQCTKQLCSPIPRTQHRPVVIQVVATVRPLQVPFRRRFNFARADWPSFSE